MFDSVDIANYFVNLGIVYDMPLTPIRLQEVIFFANGIYLARLDDPLIKQSFEPWKYAPIIPIVYETFKSWGYKPILKSSNSNTFVIDNKTLEIISDIWIVIRSVNPIKLSNWIHLTESPWFKEMNSNGIYNPIDTDDIKYHFRKSFNIEPIEII